MSHVANEQGENLEVDPTAAEVDPTRSPPLTSEFDSIDPEEFEATPRGARSVREGSEASTRREEALAQELAARDRRIEELEATCRRAIRDRELATALAGKPLVAGAAEQLITLWRDELDVYQESGRTKVASRDGRGVAEWVASRLGETEYAHFRPAPSRGGAGARGLSQSGGPDEASGPSRTLGEAVISRWRESASNRATPPIGQAGWGRRS